MSDTDYWIAWTIAAALFVAVEGQAIVEGRYRGKLTFVLRSFFAMHGKPRWWQARRAVLVAMLAWLAAHLLLPPGTF